MSNVPVFDYHRYSWNKADALITRTFTCGFCSTKVAATRGLGISHHVPNSPIVGGIYLCPNCHGPTFLHPDGSQFPACAIGNSVQQVPTDLTALYEEARRCTISNCYTAAVLLCRKLLMNIAVSQGAKAGLPFVDYVNYLATQGYVPPNGRHWVDHIRKKGNEATHEIALMKQTDATELLTFIEMLLRFIYEFPAMVPAPAKPTSTS